MRKYHCLAHAEYTDPEGFSITTIRPEDKEPIRCWRNSQMAILRSYEPISATDQEHYFDTVITPSLLQGVIQERPNQILFSFFLQNTLIGYGGLTHIDWHAKRAELSVLLDPRFKEGSDDFAHYFRVFIRLVLQVLEELNFRKLTAEVYDFRTHVISILEHSKFQLEGHLKDHVYKAGALHDAYLYGLWMRKKQNDGKQNYGVLVTSISRKVPLLETVRRAIQKSTTFTTLHGQDANANVVGRYFVDYFWHSPHLEALSVESVIAYCQEHHIRAIIPTRDADLSFFAAHVPKLQEAGITALVSPLSSVAICADKMAFAEHLTAHNLPAIATYDSLERCPYDDIIVKERYGAGGKCVRSTKASAIPKMECPIFQPYIEGREYSIDLYVGRQGQLHGVVARTRDLVEHGESQVTTTLHAEKLEALAARFASCIELYGPAVLQVIVGSDGEEHIVECNPRFGGASTASYAVGLESFYWFVVECETGTLAGHPFVRKQQDIRQVRTPLDRVFTLYA